MVADRFLSYATEVCETYAQTLHSPVEWLFETGVALFALVLTGTLWNLAPEWKYRRCRYVLYSYVTFTSIVIWAAVVTSHVRYPGGRWVIITLDICDGLMYTSLYQFFYERLASLSAQSSGQNHVSTVEPNESTRGRVARMLLPVLARLVILYNLIIAFAGGILNGHESKDGGYWIISSCWDCIPTVAGGCVSCICFSAMGFLAVRDSYARVVSSVELMLDDSDAGCDAYSAERAMFGFARNNMVGAMISCVTTCLVMFEFVTPIFPSWFSPYMSIYVDVIANAIAIHLSFSTLSLYTSSIEALVRKRVSPIVVVETNREPALQLAVGHKYHLFLR